jgi:PAS domain S-box-containing protein
MENGALLLLTAILALSAGLAAGFLVFRRRPPSAAAAGGAVQVQRYRSMVEKSPLGMHFYNLEPNGALTLVGANPAADRILGVNHRPLLGQAILEAFPQLAGTAVPEAYRRAAAEGIPWSTEQVSYDDGKIAGAFWVSAFQLSPGAMVAVFEEITERKRMEAELEDQRRFNATVLEGLPGIFYLYSYPELKLLQWNKNHETVFGFAADEIRGRDIYEWHVPEFRAGVAEAIESVMRDRINQVEAPLVAKDGRRIPFLLTGVKFDAGKRTMLMGIGIDISDRVAAEERLRELNQRLESRVAERTAELTAALAELRESQAKMLLTEKLTVLGHLVTGLAHELNTPLGAILSVGEASGEAVAAFPACFDLYRGLGAEQAAAFRRLLEAFTAADWIPDMARERAAKRRIQAALQAAGRASAGFIAEQLASAGCSGYDDCLSGLAADPRLGELALAAYRLASIARANYVTGTAAAKASKVVQALRTYGRSEADDKRTPVDVRVQLDLALTLFRNQMKDGVEVVRDFGELPPVEATADRLDQVWVNLINNAIQAMDYRGVLELAARTADGKVVVTVTDNGPGIPAELQPKLFTPFFTTKAPGEGTGLGLDICRRILAEVGGTIAAESRPGFTRFTVAIPIMPGAPQ